MCLKNLSLCIKPRTNGGSSLTSLVWILLINVIAKSISILDKDPDNKYRKPF